MSDRVHPDAIRGAFAAAMSDMYRAEVPQYGTLLDLVADVNRETLAADPALAARLTAAGELDRLDVERHGAIRLGTPAELGAIRRLFAVMGMWPVGYYDLSVAGIPVHSTAFRPIDAAALSRNPFRVFTSLLRLDLVADRVLAREAARILARRDILGAPLRTLIGRAEAEGGLDRQDAGAFVAAATRVFRWQRKATVDAGTYTRLSRAHRLIADVVCFPGPHINHLTPRTLDIDRVQEAMPGRGIVPKDTIEGPPRRSVPILLRQTSFKALEEPVIFDGGVESAHTARFGEIEQRGAALTPKGRARYDDLLARSRGHDIRAVAGIFRDFPDDPERLRQEGLVHVRYRAGRRDARPTAGAVTPLVASGALICEPQTYEDFLPVSAAGIFRSNLDESGAAAFAPSDRRDEFEEALGAPVLDEMQLYRRMETDSLQTALQEIGTKPPGRL